ncbi:hypothetical protein ccbrp13_44070 [Ktedonobacteria bacterium brp13]|nr:hypothetical protein ccbrp13_44070 [Ktedonobacteria bacterium brp13]
MTSEVRQREIQQITDKPYQKKDDITRRNAEEFASQEKPVVSDSYHSPEWARVKKAKSNLHRSNYKPYGSGSSRFNIPELEHTGEYRTRADAYKEELSKFHETSPGKTLHGITLKRENALKQLESTTAKQDLDEALKQQSDAKRAFEKTEAYRDLSNLEYSLKLQAKYGNELGNRQQVINAESKVQKTEEWRKLKQADQTVEDAKNEYENTENTPEYKRHQSLSQFEDRANNAWERLQIWESADRVLRAEDKMIKAEKTKRAAESDASDAKSKTKPGYIKRQMYQLYETKNQKNRKDNANKMEDKRTSAENTYNKSLKEWQEANNDLHWVTTDTMSEGMEVSSRNKYGAHGKPRVSRELNEAKQDWERILQEFREI